MAKIAKKEKEDFLKKLLKGIEQALSLSEQELLKSSELSELETNIPSLLNEFKEFFGDIERRKIEKINSGWKTVPRPGYIKYGEANKRLNPLKKLIEELLEAETGIKSLKIPSIEVGESITLREAIKDAKLLLEKNGSPNAVDRFHTLLHAYLKKECEKLNIVLEKETTINNLLKKLKENSPILIALQNDQVESIEILKAMGNVLSKLSELRNQKSLAHPTELLPEDEANFVIDSVNSILKYLTSKLR